MTSEVKQMRSRNSRMGRRQILLGMGGAAAVGLAGCGGGGEVAAPVATDTPLTVKAYAGGGTTAAGVVQNAAGGSVSVWTDAAGLSQSLYQNGGRTIRTYYGPSQEVVRVVDEVSGEFLVVTPLSVSRTDYNIYAANGAWKAGWAVLLNADGTYSSAQIISSGGLTGQQVTGNLSGAVAASYTMLPDGSSGLGTPTLLTKSGTAFASVAAVPFTVSVLNRLTDALFRSAYAQTVPRKGLGTSILGAFYMAAGALALGTTAGSIAIALAGVALMGYGAYTIYNGLSTIASANFNVLDSASNQILGNAYEEFSESRSPIDALTSRLSGYLASGSSALSGLPSLTTVASQAQSSVGTAASTLVAATTAAWQQVTSAPPPGSTGLTGVMVDNAGQTYQLTGTYNPATSTTTFDTGTSSTTRITGSGRTTGGPGTYTARAPAGTTVTGAVSVSERALGACQTQQSSGGQGAFSNTYDLGRDSGTFQLTYEMYNIPDRLQVLSSTGQVLYTTGGLVSGGNTVQIPFSGGRIVYVVISAPTSGTAWDYTLGCPA